MLQDYSQFVKTAPKTCYHKTPSKITLLILAHINVNELLAKSKVHDIELLLETVKFDVLGIAERKLKGQYRRG